MELSKQFLDRVCKNARLMLADDERLRIMNDLQDILNAFSVLDTIDTTGVQPSFHPVELKNKTREDIPHESLSQEDALKNSPSTHNGYFKGPKAIS